MDTSKSFDNTLNFIVLIAVIVAVGYYLYQQARPALYPCEEPLEYRLGDVDERFALSDADVFRAALEAEAVWEDAIGRDLLRYNPDADFAVNFIFDERQEATIASLELNEEIEAKRDDFDALSQDLQNIGSSYDQELVTYQQMLANYQSDVASFNAEVEKWNKRGGAPEDVFDELRDDQKKLANRFKELEQQRARVNSLAGQSQQVASQANLVADALNQDVNTFNSLFGGEREFDQGVFTGQEVNIFQFKAHEDLRLVLAHEFGHALGMGHVGDPTAIMYFLMKDQEILMPKPQAADLAALTAACAFDEKPTFKELFGF